MARVKGMAFISLVVFMFVDNTAFTGSCGFVLLDFQAALSNDAFKN